MAVRDRHTNQGRKRPHDLHRVPLDRALLLITFRIDGLPEVPLRVEERDADDRQPQVGKGPKRVARKHAQATAVRRKTIVEADLHREVGEAPGSELLRGIARHRLARIAVGVGEKKAPAILRAKEERPVLVAGRAAARRIDRHPAHGVMDGARHATLSERLMAATLHRRSGRRTLWEGSARARTRR